jgi:dihydrolipoamide dehydrogenase
MRDLVVIGGGAGGVPAAIRGAQLGGRVAIIECEDLGGLCMNRGCIPFGHMMAASEILGNMILGKDMGLDFTGVSKDYSALIRRQDKLIGLMRRSIKATLQRNGVEVLEGRAKIAGRGKVEVNGMAISCKNIILATGTQSVRPDFEGADLEEVMSSDDLLKVEELPARVLIHGRSPWAIEIAQFLHRFGSQALLVVREKTILPDESKSITSRLTRSLKGEGIEIKTNAEIVAATRNKDDLHVELKYKDGSEKVVVDRIVSVDRTVCLRGLGLESINLDEEAPYLEVNNKMETGIEGVYAIGDLTVPSSRHYSHLSSEGGIIAAENAMGLESAMNPMTLARVLFTQPQVAFVGFTPKEAEKAGYDVMVGEAPYSMNPFGMIVSERGSVEVVAEKKHGELLGASFIGRGACDMASQAVLAIHLEATVEELSRAPFPHPTLSESLAEAARDAVGKPIYLPY